MQTKKLLQPACLPVPAVQPAKLCSQPMKRCVSLEGDPVILVRRETTPEDIHGMRVAENILTELGGMTSHAAVVARGMGVCAVTGCGELSVDTKNGTAVTVNGVKVKRGDVITLDGTSGEVMLGDVENRSQWQ